MKNPIKKNLASIGPSCPFLFINNVEPQTKGILNGIIFFVPKKTRTKPPNNPIRKPTEKY